MFAYIRGKPVAKSSDYVVVDVGGVGYKLLAPVTTLHRIDTNAAEITLYTYLHVREDEMTLYGFAVQEDQRLFELLLGVSGIGPKVAVNILSSISAQDFYTAVLTNDLKLLQSVPGIGRKTAQRLVLELKEKIGKLSVAAEVQSSSVNSASTAQSSASNTETEAAAALEALGYDYREALQAVRQAKAGLSDNASVEELIKAALKRLARI